MKKILLIGASGRLAGEMIPILRKSYKLVLCSSKDSSSYFDQTRDHFYGGFIPANCTVNSPVIADILRTHRDLDTVLFLSGGGNFQNDFNQSAFSLSYDRNVNSVLRPLESFLNLCGPRPMRFIFFSSAAVYSPESNIPYASSKRSLEVAFRGYTRKYSSTNFTFSLIRLGYVRTRMRYHETLRKKNYASYIEALASIWPNLQPLTPDDVVKSITYMLSIDQVASNGLTIDLSGGAATI